MSSELENSQRILEQNEDILAAIVENLQLGRLNDCMQHYAILQANLVSLATHLDNFPAEERDPYTTLDMFPDEIMRKDLLEDFRPSGSRSLPKAPIIPACAECMAKKNSAVVCRGTLKHIEPSGKYSATEREEFYNVTQVLAARPTKPDEEGGGAKKRNYKVWAPFEKYTLLVGISLFGTEMTKLSQILEDRNAEQIRNYITKKLKKADKWIVQFNAADLMSHRPHGYQPPPLLAPYFAAHAMGLDPEHAQYAGFLPLTKTDGTDPAATASTESLLAPESGKPDFNLLLAIAAGVSTHNPESLPTRVPPPPEEVVTAAEEPMDDFTIITEVGLEQTQGSGSSAKRESAYNAAASAASGTLLDDGGAHSSRYTDMGPPTGKLGSYAKTRGLSTNTNSGGGPSQFAVRRVHWDEALPDGEEMDLDATGDQPEMFHGPSSSMGALPSLRDANFVSLLPPLPAGAPAHLRSAFPETRKDASTIAAGDKSGLSYYAQQQEEAAAKALRIQTEQAIEQERKLREESALLGLDAYNLEYARTLQAANIPFTMTSGSGTVMVVKGGGVQASSGGNSSSSSKKQPPPFARPGIQRMKKQQQEAKLLELRQLAQAQYDEKFPPGEQRAKAPPEKQPERPKITAGVYSSFPPGPVTYPIQTDTVSMSPDSFAARLQAALRTRVSPPARASKAKTTTQRQPINQPIGLAAAATESSSLYSSQPSLFSRIISGTNISPPDRIPPSTSTSAKTRTKRADRSSSSTSGATHPPTESAAGHFSAALDVSMNGYEEQDEEYLRQHNVIISDTNDQQIRLNADNDNNNMELVTNEEYSVLPEFGCEFSFLGNS